MFSDKYSCDTCLDSGAVLVYHRTKPALPYAFKCHQCRRGESSRVKDFPYPHVKAIKNYAMWNPKRAGEEYVKIRNEEAAEKET